MLVLNRKKGQRVVIGRQVEVIVLEVRGDRVKLGFRGPAEVPIHRQELYEKITNETGPHKPNACSCGWFPARAG